MRSNLLVTAIMMFVGGGNPQNSEMTESKAAFSILQPDDVAKVPVILEGLVIADGASVASPQKSTLDGSLVQLWKGRVRVENVLQGDVSQNEVEIFYFIGNIPGSTRSIRLRSGERNIFFLRRDGTKLRTNDDRSSNGCLLRVLTGPHPSFSRAPGVSINQAIIELLLTRGSRVDDKQMVAAIAEQHYLRFVGEEQAVIKLQQLAKLESPLVREAACSTLLDWRHPCGLESDTSVVTIQNLERPDGKDTFELGDRIRVTLAAAAKQTIYRSGIGRVGETDENGRFTYLETLKHLPGGTRTDVWLVGTQELSPAVTYVVRTGTTEVELIKTPIGNLRDRYGMGLSALSVAGDTVLTYSAMLVDYRTRLYYDVREADTLYEEGKPIKSEKSFGEASAWQLWETKVKSWNDYFLKGNHYLVAAFQSGTFVNPMKFSDGSCFGVSSTCQIVPLDAPAQIAKADIFLGSTGADQSAVPQNVGWALKGLDPESKALVLSTLLTRAEGADDAQMIAIIDVVTREGEFGSDLLVKKLQDVADRETPAVRAKACSTLRKLKHPCSKKPEQTQPRIRPVAVQQVVKPAIASAVMANGLQTSVPKHLVFAHFLLMMHEIDEKKVVAAFGLERLKRTHLNALRIESSTLTRELARLDLRAKRITAAYRRTGKLALQEGKPLPPVPTEICRLQAMRTAAMVNHAVRVQATLGPKGASSFEAMLAYRFTPNTNFGQLAPGEHH